MKWFKGKQVNKQDIDEEKAIEIGRNSENYIATTKIEWEE